MSQIRLTPEELNEAAKFMTERNEEISKIMTAVKEAISAIDAGWTGATKDLFKDTFDNKVCKLLDENLYSVIDGVSESLKTTAEVLEGTDTAVSDAFLNKES